MDCWVFLKGFSIFRASLTPALSCHPPWLESPQHDDMSPSESSLSKQSCDVPCEKFCSHPITQTCNWFSPQLVGYFLLLNHKGAVMCPLQIVAREETMLGNSVGKVILRNTVQIDKRKDLMQKKQAFVLCRWCQALSRSLQEHSPFNLPLNLCLSVCLQKIGLYMNPHL